MEEIEGLKVKHTLYQSPFTLKDPLTVERVSKGFVEQDVRKYGTHSRKVISALIPETASERGMWGWAARGMWGWASSWNSKDSGNILPTQDMATLTQ